MRNGALWLSREGWEPVNLAYLSAEAAWRLADRLEGAVEAWQAAFALGGGDAVRGLALSLLAEEKVRDGLGAT